MLPSPHNVATAGSLYRAARILGILSIAVIPINVVLLVIATSVVGAPSATVYIVMACLVVVQVITGSVAAVMALIHYSRVKGLPQRGWVLALVIASAVSGFGGIAAIVLGALALVALSALGGAWGRPLRLRGRILHPSLRKGSDWTRGARPDVSSLDRPTRAALEALWLHDAQKEHASVPAFSRISWMLAAVGAPAELLEGAHQAAMEEIDHTRRCFALAAGYGGRSHSVEAMPDLLVGGLDMRGDPLVHLAEESLKDGCLLEDFNADVAAECERVCRDPVTRDVLSRIAREERSHAELSWSMLAWLVERGGSDVRRAIAEAIDAIDSVPRPTAVSADKRALVEAAHPEAMRAHGRLPDERWAELWEVRVRETRERARGLCDEASREAA
jgi:hypothetical protein